MECVTLETTTTTVNTEQQNFWADLGEFTGGFVDGLLS